MDEIVDGVGVGYFFLYFHKPSSAPGPVKSKGQERVTKELKREQQSLEKKQGGKRSEKRVSRSVKREERKKDRKIHSETKTKKRRMRNKYKMDKKALKEVRYGNDIGTFSL